jgi:hypothetical protein
MDDLLKYVESWRSLVFVVVVFGFAPGFCLRLIVLAYPRTDPRRRELIAELYAVPRAKRPLWVAEQLEVALFEGLGHRVSAVIHRLTARRRPVIRRGARHGRALVQVFAAVSAVLSVLYMVTVIQYEEAVRAAEHLGIHRAHDWTHAWTLVLVGGNAIGSALLWVMVWRISRLQRKGATPTR